MNNKPNFIIAEAGVNHNGDEKLAYQLVDAAVEAGADAIKFQTFRADRLVTQAAEKAPYQKNNTNAEQSQYAMLKQLELSHAAHRQLKHYAEKQGILFLSTAFDLDSLQFLINDLQLPLFKIASGELTNGPLLLAHARAQKPLIVSTGMATLEEIEQALQVIAFGYVGEGRPSLAAFREAYHHEDAQQQLKEKVTLLHCTTEYPAPLADVNLRAMATMHQRFCLRVGYSDHTQGITVPIAAVALGACVIEKHFTLDRTLPGPDHPASLEPKELASMVKAIREVELALGHAKKIRQPSEEKNVAIARKSIIATAAIKQGDKLTENNIAVMRPGKGISPMQYWDVLGSTAKTDCEAGDFIDA